MLPPKAKVKQITTQQTIAVRHPVLRAGRPREDCHFSGDNLSTTVHYGVFTHELLVGVVTFLEQNSPLFDGEQLQLRGMAVLNEFKGQGYGKLLLKAGDQLTIQKKKNLIWCNARLIAVPFYEKYGYKKMANSFEIPIIGTHFVMYRKPTQKT